MASSRKRRALTSPPRPARARGLRGKRVRRAFGRRRFRRPASLLEHEPRVSRAVHVHHGLSPNADAWTAFCRALCKRLAYPAEGAEGQGRRNGKGLEAAAREARYEAFEKTKADVHRARAPPRRPGRDRADEPAARRRAARRERHAGARALDGKSACAAAAGGAAREIVAYARGHRLEWIEDESNARRSADAQFHPPAHRTAARVALSALARGARPRGAPFRTSGTSSATACCANTSPRKGCARRAKQAGRDAAPAHRARRRAHADRARWRARCASIAARSRSGGDDARPAFEPVAWHGERKLKLPALGGEIRFRRASGGGSCLVR